VISIALLRSHDPLAARAALLNPLGWSGEVRDAYLDVLRRAPEHFAALNDFGALLVATDRAFTEN
jgi:hypothetical protein